MNVFILGATTSHWQLAHTMFKAKSSAIDSESLNDTDYAT